MNNNNSHLLCPERQQAPKDNEYTFMWREVDQQESTTNRCHGDIMWTESVESFKSSIISGGVHAPGKLQEKTKRKEEPWILLEASLTNLIE